jgi:Protein of unknown function (DUF1579)
MPTPTPQHQRMGYFAGKWKAAGTMKLSPNGNAAPFSLTETGEWVTDGFFLETRTSMKSPMGQINSVRVMGYNPEEGLYTYNVYNSLGEHQMATGRIQGNTWIWMAEQKMNGVTTQGRYTVTTVTPDSYSFKSEVAIPGGGWATVMEGEATRLQ